MVEFTLTAEPGKQESVVTGIIRAPRALVFRVLTEAKHIPHWWGPADLTTVIDKMEARPGGSWRFVQRDAQGNEYAFRGVYHRVQPPEQVVYTFEWEALPGHILLETVTLEDHPEGTRMIDQLVFQSVADRDGMLAMGAEGGTNQSLSRLEVVAQRLAGEVGGR